MDEGENPSRPMGRKQAAGWLSSRGYTISSKTLDKLASIGGGPPYRLFGHRAIYDPVPLLAWAQGRCSPVITHTSELGARHAKA